MVIYVVDFVIDVFRSFVCYRLQGLSVYLKAMKCILFIGVSGG